MAAAAGRAESWAWCSWAPLLVFALIVAVAEQAVAARRGAVPEGTISEIRIEGNLSITSEQIRGKIKSRAGRPYDQAVIDADLTALLGTKWFTDVRIFHDEKASTKGIVLVIQVEEMPVLKDVQFIGLIEGWGHVKKKDIEEATGLKKGARADTVKAQLGIAQIQNLFEEKGYEKAQVKLLEGGKLGDTRVVYEIFEGPKFKIHAIDFVGNNFVDDGVLRTKIQSSAGYIGGLGARRSKDGLDGDRVALGKYYQDNGFFDVRISATTRPGKELGSEEITFTISEGVQYKVGQIKIEGNTQIPEAQLRQMLKMKAGQPYNEGLRELDYGEISKKYWALGCIDTKINKDQQITDEPGIVNVLYSIEEGQPYILGQIIIRGNGRTKDKVVRREALMAGLLPGELLDKNRLEIFKKRLGASQYFVSNPAMGKPIEVQIINHRKGDKPYGEEALNIDPRGVDLTRMQSPDPGDPLPGDPPAIPPIEMPAAPNPGPSSSPSGPDGVMPFGGIGGQFAPEPNTVPRPLGPPQGMPPIGPPPGLPPYNPGPPLGGQEPSLPNNNMNDVGPDRQEPFPGRSYADIVTNVDEAPTGRIMFGVGASSFGGLSGTAILHESNFDIWAIPRSFSELTSGRAFRGAGQEFRLELSPGTLINRYVVSFRDPYLFDLPLGLGVSGYQWSRYYPDWSERRSGGRVSLGYQFGPQVYADTAVRVEDVDVHGFKYPAPAALLAVAGHTTLATIRPSIRFDNRNNPMAPSSGSYIEAAFEQGFGTFTFPKFTLEGRKHFLTGSRPDGSGKRTLTTRGRFGITGRDTPIYERFFEGDYRSMRGFYYRGVGPHVLGVNTGGILETVGSIEYQFPWTASDKLQQVVFCDFGTAEANYSFTTFRASVGTGLRVVIPQISGQLPLAFDLAFPVSKAEGDRIRYFSFFIGAFW